MTGRNMLWTDEQIRFAERCQDIIWEDLVGLGPNLNPKWHMDVRMHTTQLNQLNGLVLA
jgi:hypothetical protein